MEKTDLRDVSILIPLRIDSLDRLENMVYVVKYLIKYLDLNICILHADKIQHKYVSRLLPKECNYIFVEDIDPIFHRTYYINRLYEMAESPILAIWDADVIVPPEQIIYSVISIRRDVCEVCFPYDGTFLNVDPILKDCFSSVSFDIDFLRRNETKMNVLYNSVQNGGAFFISREAFLRSKLEDEAFYGWGPEDWNRIEKWKVLGYRIVRSKGSLYHLYHSRDINGNYSSFFQRKNCHSLLAMTQVSSFDMLSNGFESTEIDRDLARDSLYSIIGV